VILENAYKLRCWLMGIVITALSFTAIAQPANNRCENALRLCPQQTVSANNIDANVITCAGCEDDFNFCLNPNSTIWFTLQTNDNGGNLNISMTNLVFMNLPGQGNSFEATLFEASLPCAANSYVQHGDCFNGIQANSNLQFLNLAANTTYYLVINGEMGANQGAQGSFNITATGSAVTQSSFVFLSTDTTVVCTQDVTTFIATVNDCNDPSDFTWFVNDSIYTITQVNAWEAIGIPDGAVVRVEVTCDDPCFPNLGSNEVEMEVISFFVDAGEDAEIIEGEEFQLSGDTDAPDFFWLPDIAISNPNALQPVVSPSTTTIYTLHATDGYCTQTDFVTITVISELDIPNTFSPNGDGINDTWVIPGMVSFPNSLVRIYNRWGQLVFQTTGYSPEKAWNGKMNNTGRDLAPSAYYYVIELRDGNDREPIKGAVSLVR
jgi:gliding motility-associated-like protein